jgi:uncharacterized protein (DUF885 family)
MFYNQIGQLEILKLRAKAENALGDRFDLKKFHYLCLMSGSLPLNVLGEQLL